ncbi:cytochrome P450 monooxygenase-like protein [Xylaria scruposa]|nr:cytochrome P450 monooxygenase-like protein [Xylaria scruposa]
MILILGLSVFLLLVVYMLGWTIYTLWLHPLSKYPGPRIAAITNFWYAWAWTSGRWPLLIEEAHHTYGDIVRIAPNDLSFVTPQAYRDIYAQPTRGRKLFPKTKYFWTTIDTPGMTHIMDVDKATETRNLLSPGFSPKALRSQERVIQEYADLFVQTLDRISSEAKQAIDISDAFNWATFDILGELAFGESFGAVQNAKTHFWTSVVLTANFFQILPGLMLRLPILKLAGPFFMSKADASKYEMHRRLTMEKIRKRIQLGDRANADFFSHVLKGEFTDKELASHASVFMVAGAETTATSLTAITTFLAQNKRCFGILKDEIRSAFKDSLNIDGESTARLPYLKAVIEEGLRLFPPLALGFPRDSPGETIDGHYIPEGVIVSADIRLVSIDPRNFPDPHLFKPERWIDKERPIDRRLTNLAFLLGPRGCLGLNMAQLEMRIVLAKLVLAFDWDLVNPELDLVRDSHYMVMWQKPAVMVRFTRRP